MFAKSISVFIVVLILSSCKNGKEAIVVSNSELTAKFSIEILTDEGNLVIDKHSSIEILADGFTWTEGPLYIENGDYLLFSDIPNSKVFKIDAQGKTSVYLHPSGNDVKNYTGKEAGSNALMYYKDQLILMQQGERRIAKMKAPIDSPKESYEMIVDTYEGKRLNSPNDGVFDALGNLYFTDPPYGLPNGINDVTKELDFQGVYCLLTSGELILLDKEIKYPNGITLSPDEKTLYVAASDPEKAAWYSYKIAQPGTVSDKRLFYDVTALDRDKKHKGLPDGMKTNHDGYLFATGPDGVWVFNPNGVAIARIHTGVLTANCALSTDESQLFLTADDYILKVTLK
ncbi:Gluconolactonase [Cellulophaga algicola DSM 14237]|uniref:Gluconolactonase n=1 Tax=Cellulophaga algicola (strain DSM 14237 / IC166 / ACAM 630) TaxID=688270 RepID=E6X922_CELAD|nr:MULTISPECIES: SMP-30/gluconolactonase/LRE family protein [Cellulophaga]ADV49793.1 Gluconolactonase [Cellulophaga algicola DSM 14237]